MSCSMVLSVDKFFCHVIREYNPANRVQTIAVTFGLAVTIFSILVLAAHQYTNFTAAKKIQNAFAKQYAELVSGKLASLENEARGLQAFLYALNKNKTHEKELLIHLDSAWVWNDLSRLLESKVSWVNLESSSKKAFTEPGITELSPSEEEFLSSFPAAPVLLVRNSGDIEYPENFTRLTLAIPLEQQPPGDSVDKESPAYLQGHLTIELNPQDLQKILELFEYTTKFATSLVFTNGIHQQFEMHSRHFSDAHSSAFTPGFPGVSNEMEALGGRWVLQLMPTTETVKFAGFDIGSMLIKLTGCFLLGFMAWLLTSYSFHRIVMRQRQKLLVNLEKANLDLVAQTHKLHSSKENAEDFIGILGHEIRNPLTTLRYVQEELAHLHLSDKVQHLLSIQDSALTTALDTLNNTLDLKKMELSALELEIIPFDLQLIIEEIRGLIALQCRNKRITLNIRLDRDIPPRLKGDPLRIKQVLLNLMNNAVKFTKNGDVVELNISVSSATSEFVVLNFAVIDTGRGIEPAVIERLMEPYIQADNSIARQYGGTGLGLNIASRIVELMGGKLQVESTLGVGSKFMFRLSFEIATMNNENKNRRMSALQQKFDPAQPRLGLLYVDDNDFNLMVADELIKKSGHQLFTFNHPLEALDFIKQSNGNIDIVISDLRMPEMSGIEFARQVRETRCGDLALLVAITASTTEERAELETGDFDCVLNKPFNLKTIVSSYEEFKARGQARDF